MRARHWPRWTTTRPSRARERLLILEPGRAERHYWADLWTYRELFAILAWRDVAVRYKQTVIGLAWAIVRPLLTMVIFTVIFGTLARLPSDGGTPYPLLVFAGMLPWFLFSSILTDASNSLINNTHLIGKVYLCPVYNYMLAQGRGSGCMRFRHRPCTGSARRRISTPIWRDGRAPRKAFVLGGDRAARRPRLRARGRRRQGRAGHRRPAAAASLPRGTQLVAARTGAGRGLGVRTAGHAALATLCRGSVGCMVSRCPGRDALCDGRWGGVVALAGIALGPAEPGPLCVDLADIEYRSSFDPVRCFAQPFRMAAAAALVLRTRPVRLTATCVQTARATW